MLDKQIAFDILQCALENGADFCDIFVEKTLRNSIHIQDSAIDTQQGGVDFGIGIRVIYGHKALYGYTNIIEKNELIRITKVLCKAENQNKKRDLVSLNFKKAIDIHPCHSGLDKHISVEEKLNYLLNIDRSCRTQSSKISQVKIASTQSKQDVEIFNSEGLHTSDTRHHTRITGFALAIDGQKHADGFYGPGAMNGWDMTKNLDAKWFGEHIAKKALTSLIAKPCPAGNMPVIIDNGFGGVIFHEACGHLLETTSVQTQSSVFHDKMGELIANPVVNAVDDGTMPNAWGSINIDDEGMSTQRTQLIKDGVLTSFMVDYIGELKTGYKRTGSARRQNYHYAPASRMRNTFIEAGPHKLEELISSIDNGLYAASMGGGSVKPGTGEFNFAVTEGYLIKNGKIDQPVSGATLIGTGPEVLKQISMVADNFEISAGMCGSVSGSIPASVGQSALKVDQILVGGKA